MSSLLITLNVIISLLLIGAILLQPGTKGGGLGTAFGGGGANTAFGAQGAAPVLSKITYWLAGAFFATLLAIEYRVIVENRSVLEKPSAAKTGTKPAAPAPAAPTPAAPAPAPAHAPSLPQK
ncbi:MAG: preprotein translocase subunit SecG [Holophagaceae bacterium]